jgi:hypothetical protein
MLTWTEHIILVVYKMVSPCVIIKKWGFPICWVLNTYLFLLGDAGKMGAKEGRNSQGIGQGVHWILKGIALT